MDIILQVEITLLPLVIKEKYDDKRYIDVGKNVGTIFLGII